MNIPTVCIEKEQMSAVISIVLFYLSKVVEEGLPLYDWYLNLCRECYSRN